MASLQADRVDKSQEYKDPGAGTGPEYYFPTTDKDATIPVLDKPDPDEEDAAAPPVAGEDAPELSEEEISREERLEKEELGDEEWSEDLAQNTPLPGEAPDLLPEESERMPSDQA